MTTYYPWMSPYTVRQLGTMARQVEELTEARRAAEAVGETATPDSFPVRFPGGHWGVVHWAPAELKSERARVQHAGAAPWRYILDLGPNRPHLGEFDPAPYGQAGQTGTDGWVVQKMREMAKAPANDMATPEVTRINAAVVEHMARVVNAGRAHPNSA